MSTQAKEFIAMETLDDFIGLDPMTGRYEHFQNKADWLNHLLLIDHYQMIAKEERRVCENPWHLAILQNKLGMEVR